MSDANKSMIDASGRLIRGATHPYVLADDLYPMWTAEQEIDVFQRGYRSSTEQDIWTLNWGLVKEISWEGTEETAFPDGVSNEYTAAQFGYMSPLPTYSAYQLIVQTKFLTNTIDWSRVKSLSQKFQLEYGIDEGSGGWTARVTTAKDTASMPADKTIRDSWDTAFTTTSAGSHEVTVKWVVDGVEPTSLEVAFMFDNDSNPTPPINDLVYLFATPLLPVRIIYNLATA
jgi:hypothetical protein